MLYGILGIVMLAIPFVILFLIMFNKGERMAAIVIFALSFGITAWFLGAMYLLRVAGWAK